MSNSNQTTIQATHSRRATVEARKALHWYGFCTVDKQAHQSVTKHASTAGEYACYSGMALPVWRSLLEDCFAVESVVVTFEAAYHATADLMGTPTWMLAD